MSGGNICGPRRFHVHHGSNIQLEENQTVATRKTSFANGLTFSERPLDPGEIFLVEIEENETGWSGHMRLGLTQMNPNQKFELPLYALPYEKKHFKYSDLVSMGPSWLYAITQARHNVYDSDFFIHPDQLHLNESDDESDPPSMAAIEQNLYNYRRYPRVVHREGNLIRTPNGLIHQNKLMPKQNKMLEKNGMCLIPTDVGSRIGVMFVPTSEEAADMHFIINGEDQGPCSRDIPYKDSPLFAVVDVYGLTKKIRLVQVEGVESLQELCRDAILRSIKLSGVTNLPLPKLLKDYLLYDF